MRSKKGTLAPIAIVLMFDMNSSDLVSLDTTLCLSFPVFFTPTSTSKIKEVVNRIKTRIPLFKLDSDYVKIKNININNNNHL